MKEKIQVKNSWIALTFLIIIFVLYLVVKPHPNKHRAIEGVGQPIQNETTGSTQLKVDDYSVDIKYLYSYEISALVVSTEKYSSGLPGKLAPRDFALAWGVVAANNDKINFHWSQSNRWYFWKINSGNDESNLKSIGGMAVVSKNSSNNHLIPSDDVVKKQIKRIRTGDYIRLKGYLVNVSAKNSEGRSYTWNSSTTRNDTGDGSCELIYVTDLEKLD